MKIMRSFFIPLLLSLAACSTTQTGHGSADAKELPETVMITYHVKLGKETEMEDLLRRAWETYRRENMVFTKTHLIVSNREAGDKTRLVEIFTWVTAPDHAPDSVKVVWKEMHELCEARDGHDGLEFAEIKLIVPKAP